MTKNYSVTLKALRQAGACCEGYNKLVRSLQGLPFTQEDEDRESYLRYRYEDRISLGYILEANGFDDALWAIRACEQTPELLKDVRLYAVWCARQVQHLMTDASSIAAIDTVERYVNGLATKAELDAAWAAADAAWATDAAYRAAYVARAAARAATHAATDHATAYDTARAAAYAAYAAAYAATDHATAYGTARAAQSSRFVEVFCS